MKTFFKKIVQKVPLLYRVLKKLKNVQIHLDVASPKENSLMAKLTTYSENLEQSPTQRQNYIVDLYKFILEREPEETEVTSWFNSSYNTIELFNIFTQSQEYQEKNNKAKKEREEYVIALYKFLLEREPKESEISNLSNWNYNPIDLFNIFTQSQEYQDKKNQREQEYKNYVMALYKYILQREPEESELRLYRNSSYSFAKLLESFVTSEEYQDKNNSSKIDLSSVLGVGDRLVGEQKPVTANKIFSWYKNLAEILLNQHNENKYLQVINNRENKYLEAYSIPIATIITSLYKGRKYIKDFLNNITNQTSFNKCELIIVDANSPEKEDEIIKEYLQVYSNINYIKLKERIGIYEAWNLAIKESNSEFITNANVDDLHRYNGLELKVQTLMENPLVDVVYSDVYYSFVANLPFEIAEKCNLKTNLPIANKLNLLSFNSPHNSPMWRRALHDKIGYFDTSYKSAADYEFWLRAAFSGSSFMKISQPVVLYYHNPQGMSTKEKSPGQIEAEKILKIYKNLLKLEDC